MEKSDTAAVADGTLSAGEEVCKLAVDSIVRLRKTSLAATTRCAATGFRAEGCVKPPPVKRLQMGQYSPDELALRYRYSYDDVALLNLLENVHSAY